MFMSTFGKVFGILMTCLSVLIGSWECMKADAPLNEAIPEESIRLRILADSDAPADQALKLKVRDAVVAAISGWAAQPRTLDEAREYIRASLPELEELVRSVVAEAGYTYDIRAELGVVSFPTKVYGGRLYPAGDYEALRITIGRGLGQNWWCVLFPPLCFVDIAAGETPSVSGLTALSAALAGEEGEASYAPDEGLNDIIAHGNEPKVEYRFFLLEAITAALEAIRSWFGM